MARILVSAYACEPGRGSEPSVGWSWATELARLRHQVTVLTRAANRQSIELESRHLRQKINFIYFDLPLWVQRVRHRHGGKQIYYVLWQWFAARAMRKRLALRQFDFVQHVTYVSVRYPSFMGSLGITFYFGPVSGGEAVPPALRAGFPAGGRVREELRDISNRLVKLDPLMRRTFRQADRILVTPDTLPLLPRNMRHKARATLAIGLPSRLLNETCRPARPQMELRVLYVGRLLDWKGIDIALQALRFARERRPMIRFTVAGDGPAKPYLTSLCHDLQLDNVVHWLGWIPRHNLTDYYQSADLLLFPSLRDSGGMVVLEALAHGLPVVATDLGGPGLIVDRSCGRTVATRGCTPQQLARKIADALLEIAADRQSLESLSRGAGIRAQQFAFENLVRSVYPESPQGIARPA